MSLKWLQISIIQFGYNDYWIWKKKKVFIVNNYDYIKININKCDQFKFWL